MNGKEDCCIDVQHKKRGRPRLRDDRDNRFDPRFPSTSSTNNDTARRPLGSSSTYPSSSPTVAPGESAASRFVDRTSAPAPDTSIYSQQQQQQPLSIATSACQEPMAYLMLKDLEIVKASPSFNEAVGITSTYGVKLIDVLAPSEREKIKTLNNELREEQERSQPNYLPPIFAETQVGRVIQSLNFSPESAARFNMDRRDRWSFQSAAGQIRPHNVRFGLAALDSIYFVVLQILPQNRFPYPSPSPHPSASSYAAYPSQSQTSQPAAYGQPTPVSATFDPSRAYGENSLGPRQPPQQIHPGQLMAGHSPGISPGLSTYAASPSRPDYPMGPTSFHTPRTEMPGTPRQQSLMNTQVQAQTHMQAQQQVVSQADGASGCHQLPPIRGQTPGQAGVAVTHSMMSSVEPMWMKDDRGAAGRVNIEGLLERPSHLQQQPPSA
ncbi:hypothetical protein TD95_003478 [Thielaviopsis punctulata]|uniref:PAS domain-containing protein n=1 Tax=Thielaviopsis punctulata TaxID=72032 RepID=A0A0F4ZBQ1_9PEZI|nr:hypothetical protein TD95_003478 [Thielaviopsis punctulata]